MKTDNSTYLQPQALVPGSAVSDDTEGMLDLGRVARTLARKWWIIAGVAIASTAAASFKVITDVPLYAGSFEVLVQPGSAETDVIANIPETLTNGEPPSQIAVDEDLLKILKSPKVLETPIEQIKLRYPDLCQVPVALQDSPEAAASLCYETIANSLSVNALKDALDDNSTIVRVAFRSEDPAIIQFVLAQVSQAYLDYSLETKQADISRGIEFVEQKLPDLRDKVNVLQTRLQDLRLQNDIIDPNSRATQIAEQVGTFSREQRELAVELQQARAIAEDLRSQTQQNQEQQTSVALNDNPRYQTLLNTLLELDAEIAEASTLYLDTAPEMQVLQEQRENLLGLLGAESSQSQREISSQIRQLEAREQALAQTLQGLNTATDNLTGVARTYDDIQRELGIATENLSQFITKREALEIDAAQREIPWELVTPPTVPKPVSSSLVKYMLLGGTLGLLLGIGLALLVDESSGIIYSEEDIKRTTRLPLLGAIPAYSPQIDTVTSQRSAQPITRVSFPQSIKARQYANVSNGSKQNGLGQVRPDFSFGNALSNGSNGNSPYRRNPFLQSFRTLHTNLRLLNSQRPVRSVVVSSVMPDEGKSTVALHLAKAAAATGQHVLLIDADLRNPHLHQYLEISNKMGLTNLFSGETNPNVIQKVSSDSMLFVLTAGSVEFEPGRLFSSPSMKKFIERINPQFDLIIYDTPPLLDQSDAYLIASKTDGLLLVTQPGKLKQSLLDRAMEQLRVTDINLLGVVTCKG